MSTSSSAFKGAFEKLSADLPQFVNLDELAGLVEKFKVPTGAELWGKTLPEVPSDADPAYAWASVLHLVSALDWSWVDIRQAGRRGLSMTAADHWVDYWRQTMNEANDIASVDSYVDWERCAREALTDYTEVKVEIGTFKGTWYVRS